MRMGSRGIAGHSTAPGRGGKCFKRTQYCTPRYCTSTDVQVYFGTSSSKNFLGNFFVLAETEY